MNFDSITPLLTDISERSKVYDRANGEHHQFLFDHQLFQTQSYTLQPYVKEVQKSFAHLVQEYEAKRLSAARAQYLTERLLAQISAITRELATTQIRKKEPKHWQHNQVSMHQLYQDLSQHIEWERRLKTLVEEQKEKVAQTFGPAQGKAQQALLKAEERLKRCQIAKNKIENRITRRESVHYGKL